MKQLKLPDLEYKIKLTESEIALLENIRPKIKPKIDPKTKKPKIFKVVKEDYEVLYDLASHYAYRKLSSQWFLTKLRKEGKYIDNELMCEVYGKKSDQVKKFSLGKIEYLYKLNFNQIPVSRAKYGR